jgi:hypothetical protein
MKHIFYSILLIFSSFFISSALFAQDDSNLSHAEDVINTNPNTTLQPTKFYGFHLGQHIDDVVTNCQTKLKYKISSYSLNTTDLNGISAIACEPLEESGTTSYNKITRGKPVSFIFLLLENKIFGLHLTFLSKNVYKKALVNFLNSNVIKTNVVTLNFVGDVTMYQNVQENWNGWFSEINIEFVLKDKQVEKRIYIIHTEYDFNQ